MLNVISVGGRLVKDPELRKTRDGTSVTSFTLAVERNVKNSEGRYDTDFIDCTAWRQTAEFACKYFRKGEMMIATGALQSRKWTDKSGQNRTSWEILVSSVYFGGGKRDDAQGGARRALAADEMEEQDADAFDELDEEDGELPF